MVAGVSGDLAHLDGVAGVVDFPKLPTGHHR